jgi:hypothetical protein
MSCVPLGKYLIHVDLVVKKAYGVLLLSHLRKNGIHKYAHNNTANKPKASPSKYRTVEKK